MGRDASEGRMGLGRRRFVQSVGVAGCAALMRMGGGLAAWAGESPEKRKARVRCAFLYPPSETLQGGWWSWPGNDFDAEGRQATYSSALRGIERDLGMRIITEDEPIHSAESLARFIDRTNGPELDGLVLIPLKHSHFAHVDKILAATDVPTIIFTCVGVKHGPIRQYLTEGTHVIASLDNTEALTQAMRMVATSRWMRESVILSIAGEAAVADETVRHLGTTARRIPISRFVEEVERTETDREVREIARAFRKDARRVCEPKLPEILTAARVHVALARLIEAEGADAVTMDCLRRGEYQPCMSFMRLRDEGIAAGCENDFRATLTLMLVQQLFDRPGFQHNPCFETEANHYFASHCTCASKLMGTEGPTQPYLLRNFAHTNDPTCVPQVLWREGEPVTMARYEADQPPAMRIYSGEVVKSYAMPPVGGCRTNVEITINELPRAADVGGHHNVLFYGDYADDLRTYCRLFGIQAVA